MSYICRQLIGKILVGTDFWRALFWPLLKAQLLSEQDNFASGLQSAFENLPNIPQLLYATLPVVDHLILNFLHCTRWSPIATSDLCGPLRKILIHLHSSFSQFCCQIVQRDSPQTSFLHATKHQVLLLLVCYVFYFSCDNTDSLLNLPVFVNFSFSGGSTTGQRIQHVGLLCSEQKIITPLGLLVTFANAPARHCCPMPTCFLLKGTDPSAEMFSPQHFSD